MHSPRLHSILVTTAALAPLALLAPRATAEPPGPIHVIIDVHCDPILVESLPEQSATYVDRVAALDWILDTSEPYGARLSYLSTGQFMEWVLEEPTLGFPVIQRLYESGGSVGTHSHKLHRIGPFDWEDMGPNPPQPLLDKQWRDHIEMVDRVVQLALRVPAEFVREVNNVRGAWLDDHELRLQMMADWGFSTHEQGPDELFALYFEHYAWNAYRPSGENFLVHDADGPVVVSPLGTVLGHVGPHYGFDQDMSLPAVQARFLMEVLNWLDDVHVAQTGRVWTTGWGSHAHDIIDDARTRDAWEPMLQWLNEHFIDGDFSAAHYSSMIDSRDAYLAWEASHPGETPFSYAPEETVLSEYPYLLPVYHYMAGARYDRAEPAVGSVRWHGVDTADDGSLWVLYPADDQFALADLMGYVPDGPLAAIDPRSGRFVIVPPAAVPVLPQGIMLVPAPNARILPGFGDLDGDGQVTFNDLLLVLAEWGPCDEPPLPGACGADLDGNGVVGFRDLLIVLGQWS